MRYLSLIAVLVLLSGCASIGAKEYDISSYTIYRSDKLTIVKYPSEWFVPDEFNKINESKKQQLRDQGAPAAMLDQYDRLLVHTRGMELMMMEDTSTEKFAYCRLGFIFNKSEVILIKSAEALRLKLRNPQSGMEVDVASRGMLVRNMTGQESDFYDSARCATTIKWDLQKPEEGSPILIYARVDHEYWGWKVLEASLE